MLRALVPLVVCVVLVRPATATTSLGHLAASAVPDAAVSYLCDPPLFEAFDVHLVAAVDYGAIGRPEQNASNAIAAWEAQLRVDPVILVLGHAVYPLDGLTCDLNGCFGEVEENVFDYVVGPRTPIAIDTVRPLVSLTLFIAESVTSDVLVGVGPVSAQRPYATPAWLEAETSGECTDGTGDPTPCLFSFASTRNLDTGPCPSADSDSFGTLKARY